MTPSAKDIYQYLLAKDGVNQSERFTAALNPENLKMDNRSAYDLVKFVSDMSAQIRFYDQQKQPQGDWRSFFDLFRNGGSLIAESQLSTMLSQRNDIPPHLALLLAYLKVFSFVQNDLNTLPGRRLDYYYQEVLQLQRGLAQPDQVHLIFEPAKNASPVPIPAGTLADAGKTNNGLPIQYALNNDIVVSQTTIGSIKSAFTDFNNSGKKIIFKAEDATTVNSGTSTAWRPFGAPQLTVAEESRTMQPATLGWAIASPNLLLAEGSRIVKLSFKLSSVVGITFPGVVLSSLLDISITGEKGWIKPDQILKAELTPDIPLPLQDPTVENPFELTVWVMLKESSPAVTAYNSAIHLASFATPWPVIRLSVLPESYLIETLSDFRIDQVTIEVSVTGMKNLILQNDQAIQPSDKPILPFGSAPLIGANFYIGSQEAFSKTLTSLNVSLQWQDPPKDLALYYSGYGNSVVTTSAFTANVNLLSYRNWDTRLLTNQTLFNSLDTTQVKEMPVPEVTFSGQTAGAPFIRDPELVLPGSFESTQNQGFIEIVLLGPTTDDLGNQPPEAPFEAFGHKSYPVEYTKKVIALSQFSGSGTPPELPKTPYTPTLKKVTLDYTAKDTLVLNNPNTIDQYFVEDIFGAAEIGKNDETVLIAQQAGNGELFIGLQNATVPQSVSFLFQAEEGNVPGATLLNTGDIAWSYLAGNSWRNIASNDVIEDSTEGLQKPGLIRLNVGFDASIDHTLLPAGMHWLRASVKDNPQGAAALDALLVQAGLATLALPEPSSGYEDHLSALLDSGTISKLVKKIPSIKKITQPYRSFGGRAPESNQSFYTRVSERLRHKNRAVASWDYERLLLESYPEIYKVKCIPHSASDNAIKPGSVWMVIVPDWRKRATGDPLQPNANLSLLRDIGTFIRNTFTTPFAEVNVTNPTYETLLVDCKVSFKKGFDPGFYSAQLEEDLKRFLSPWAYSEGQDIVFGGKIYASEIMAFIEGRIYVDFVVDFELYHRHPEYTGGGIGDMEIGFDFIVGSSPEATISTTGIGTDGKTINIDFVVGVPVEVAAATRPDSILVSNSKHRIEALQDGMSSCQGIETIGIGEMIVGLDFILIS